MKCSNTQTLNIVRHGHTFEGKTINFKEFNSKNGKAVFSIAFTFLALLIVYSTLDNNFEFEYITKTYNQVE